MYDKNQPSKLVDCREHGVASGAELFIVEGNFAAAAVAKQRDGHYQAVLPMQGKPMNSLHVSLEKLVANVLYAALIQAIGAGVGQQLTIADRRYQRIILMMDPDADGIHCGALMTLFFHQWMRPLLAEGVVYLVRPPVGQRTHRTTQQIEYAYTVPHFREMLVETNAIEYDHMQYRGLASIPPLCLANCCINPETRRQIILTNKDAKMAMEVVA